MKAMLVTLGMLIAAMIAIPTVTAYPACEEAERGQPDVDVDYAVDSWCHANTGWPYVDDFDCLVWIDAWVGPIAHHQGGCFVLVCDPGQRTECTPEIFTWAVECVMSPYFPECPPP